jgi:hypothetical protein
VEPLAIGCGDSGTLLATVLESEQSEEGKPSYILIRGIDTKNAASLAQTSPAFQFSPDDPSTINYNQFPLPRSICCLPSAEAVTAAPENFADDLDKRYTQSNNSSRIIFYYRKTTTGLAEGGRLWVN